MKTIILILLQILFFSYSFSQLATFRQFSEPYADLTNDFVPFPNYKWDTSFSFDRSLDYDIVFDTLIGINVLVQGNGYISLSKQPDPVEVNLWASPLFINHLVDRSLKLNLPQAQSPVSYKTDMVNGEKVFKVQWKNVGFLYGSPNDYANFQCWLFSQSQKVQFRYGDSFITSIDSICKLDSMQIGLELMIDNLSKSTYLIGNPNNVIVSNSYFAKFFGIPPSGTVYEFKSLSASSNIFNFTNTIKYKLIDHNLMVITDSEYQFMNLKLYDLNGRLVAIQNGNTLSYLGLNPGIYMLFLQTDIGFFKQKVFLAN